jgi:hypothetical protein
VIPQPGPQGVGLGGRQRSPPSPRSAASTAATAPDRRSVSTPSRHTLAEIGSGWPPQALSRCRAVASSSSKRRLASAGGRGSTFSDTSTIRPRVPRLPAIARDTS